MSWRISIGRRLGILRLRRKRKAQVTIGSNRYHITSLKIRTYVIGIFFKAVQEPTLFDECGLDNETKAELLRNIQQKLTQQAVKIRADVEVACYSYEGIDAVKDALR